MNGQGTEAKPPTIALFGLFGVGNLGNDSTYVSTLANLRQRLPDVDVLCITPAPQAAREIFGDPAISFDPGPGIGEKKQDGRIGRLLRRMVKELAQWAPSYTLLRTLDLLVIAGTGAFDDFGLSRMGIPYRLFRWSILAWLSRTPIIILSSGVGPIHSRLSRFFMLVALRLARVRSYRDTVSRDYLESMGFSTRGDAILPDLVFGMPEGTLPEYSEPANPPLTVGLGVMGYYGWRNSSANGEAVFQSYIRKMQDFATWLVESGYQVRIVYGEPASDRRAAESVFKAVSILPHAAQSIQSTAIEKAADLAEALSRVDIVVATRFHNVVYALMLGRPVLSLSYARKNDALLQEMGLGIYHLPVDSFDVESLKTLFIDLVQAGESARSQIRTTNRRYRSELERYFDDLWGAVPETSSPPLGVTEILI